MSKQLNVALWVAQGALAALFLFAGGMKLVMPIATMTSQTPLPGAFIRFIGVAEVAGALGLILPGLTGIRTALTSLAAAGLVVIMIGAVSITLTLPGRPMLALPAVTGILAALVCYGRWQRVPLRPRARRHEGGRVRLAAGHA